MTQCTCFVTFLVKCRDLRALCRILAEMVAIYVLCRILAEMSRFMCFVRHKFSAARHRKLFCTPALLHPGDYSVVVAVREGVTPHQPLSIQLLLDLPNLLPAPPVKCRSC